MLSMWCHCKALLGRTSATSTDWIALLRPGERHVAAAYRLGFARGNSTSDEAVASPVPLCAASGKQSRTGMSSPPFWKTTRVCVHIISAKLRIVPRCGRRLNATLSWSCWAGTKFTTTSGCTVSVRLGRCATCCSWLSGGSHRGSQIQVRPHSSSRGIRLGAMGSSFHAIPSNSYAPTSSCPLRRGATIRRNHCRPTSRCTRLRLERTNVSTLPLHWWCHTCRAIQTPGTEHGSPSTDGTRAHYCQYSRVVSWCIHHKK